MASSLAVTIVEPLPPPAAAAARIAAVRIPEVSTVGTALPAALTLRFVATDLPGFNLTTAPAGNVCISATLTREFIAGVGRLLALLREPAVQTQGLPTGEWPETPRFPQRVHYLPGHFGNSFEVAWPGEMARYLEDLALWGASGYGDWFDPNDMPDPYHPHVYFSGGMALWHRKKQFLRIARDLGLECVLAITHNVGFTDQMRPEWVGVRDHRHRVQGQVLCPSLPAAHAVCLQNYENLFADLAESGVHLDRLVYAPYDDGGCACSRCQPNYYRIFLAFVLEIHAIAQRHFPAIGAEICGWWTSDEEMRQLLDFARGPARAWFRAFEFSVSYGVRALPDLRATLGDLPLSTFFHIAFSSHPADVYLKTGLHSAPRRIQGVVQSYAAQGCLGFTSYNESFGDHFNEFLVTRLARQPETPLPALIGEYVRQMYGLRGADQDRVVEILLAVEELDASQAAGWATALRAIEPRVQVPPRQAWAYAHLLLKAELMALDARIGDGRAWQTAADVAPVRALIEERLRLQEVLCRDVYGLGTLRHILAPHATMAPDWYPYFRRVVPEPLGRIRPGMVSAEA